MHPLLADSWVAAQIDAAVAPYLGLWPPAAVAAFRDEMAATLATHPAAIRLLSELHPGTETSGEVRVTGMVSEAEVAAANRARSTGTR
jgi:hypothetical protein